MYADVELLLTGWLTSRLGVRCVTDLPADLGVEPVVQVSQFAADDAVPTLDRISVDIDVYVGADHDGNPQRAVAKQLAEQARHQLRFVLPGSHIGQAVFTRTDTITGPVERPYDNGALRRFHAAYSLVVHSNVSV